MASKNVERGKHRERVVARALSRALGIRVQRIPASGAGSGLGDLVDAEGRRYEVKKADTMITILRHIANLHAPHQIFCGSLIFDPYPASEKSDPGEHVLKGTLIVPETKRLSSAVRKARKDGCTFFVLQQGRWVWVAKIQ